MSAARRFAALALLLTFGQLRLAPTIHACVAAATHAAEHPEHAEHAGHAQHCMHPPSSAVATVADAECPAPSCDHGMGDDACGSAGHCTPGASAAVAAAATAAAPHDAPSRVASAPAMRLPWRVIAPDVPPPRA